VDGRQVRRLSCVVARLELRPDSRRFQHVGEFSTTNSSHSERVPTDFPSEPSLQSLLIHTC